SWDSTSNHRQAARRVVSSCSTTRIARNSQCGLNGKVDLFLNKRQKYWLIERLAVRVPFKTTRQGEASEIPVNGWASGTSNRAQRCAPRLNHLHVPASGRSPNLEAGLCRLL